MARCEHDAVMDGANNEKIFLNIKALNEWDSKVSRAKRKVSKNLGLSLLTLAEKNKSSRRIFSSFNGSIILHRYLKGPICIIF